MKAEILRKLTSCNEHSVLQLARELKIIPSTASTIRMQFLRQLSGQCVLCEKSISGAVACYYCRKHYKDRILIHRSPLSVLKQLKFHELLTKIPCQECGHTFAVTVGMVLRNKENEALRIPQLCGACWKAKEERNRLSSFLNYKELTFNAFQGLQGLKIAQKPAISANCMA